MEIPLVTLQDGVEIPVVGMGTFQIVGKQSFEAVSAALDLGYTHIDTAEVYGNHREIARAIANVRRSNLFITSKVAHGHLAYEDVLEACDRALQELQIDYLDLYLVHWPNRKVPMKETFDAMHRLVEDGKIRAMGVSNFTVRHLKEAIEISTSTITVNQVEFHPLLYQRDLLTFCKKQGIQIVAYSPLGQGVVLSNDAVLALGKKHSRTPAQISLRWLTQKGLVVIPRSSSRDHLQENLSIHDFELSGEDVQSLENLPHKRVVVPPFAEFDYV